MNLVQKLKETQVDSSYFYIEKGLQLSKQLNNHNWTIDFLLSRGGYHWTRNEYIPAIEDYNETMSLSKKWNWQQGIFRSFVNLGQVYSKLGDYPRAIEFFLKGIALGDSIKFNNSLAYNSLAVAYKKNNNLDQAVLALEESLRILKTSAEPKATGLMGGIYINLGNIYTMKGNLSLAMNYQERALHFFDSLHQIRGIVACYNNIAEVLIRQKKFPEALPWVEKSYELCKKNHLSGNQSSALHALAAIATATGNNLKAVEYLREAIELSEKSLHTTELIELYSAIATSYETLGKNDLALSYLKKHIAARDSVFNEESNAKMTNLRIGFEINKREIDNKLFQQEREINILNRNILISLITALIIITLLLGYYQYIRIKKNKLLLSQMEIIHETKEKLLQTDLENQKLKQEELQREIDKKSLELTTHALNLIQKNEMLEEIKEGLVDIDGDVDMQPEVKKDIRKLVSSINLSHHQDREWLAFKTHFEQIHVGFFEKLQQEYPDLSGNDIKICSLVKLNLGSKETASILGISAESVKTARYRLRKKLKLDPSQNLVSFLSGFK